MITVACVYWVPPNVDNNVSRFPVWWVEKLKIMVERHLSLPHRFVCLSNINVPCERIPLKHDWRKWWSKIELFRPGLFEGEVLYLDLDSVILDSIDDMFFHGFDFVGLRPFNPVRSTWDNYFGSAIMSWQAGNFTHIYKEFKYSFSSRYKGDQDYIAEKLQEKGVSIHYWQDLVPGIVSYKRHIVTSKASWGESKIVCFHGRPTPHSLFLKDKIVLQ